MPFKRHDRVRLTQGYQGMPAGLEGIALGITRGGGIELVTMDGFGVREISVQYLEFIGKGKPG